MVRPTILILEDEAELGDSFADMVEMWGATAKWFRNSDNAYDALVKGDMEVDAYLIDLEIPGSFQDGYDFVRKSSF